MLLNVSRNHFSFAEVLALTGASRWDLVSFLRAGVVRASIKDTEGPGDHRVFSADDVFAVRLARELKQLGLGTRQQQRFVHQVVQMMLLGAKHKSGVPALDDRWPADVDILVLSRLTPAKTVAPGATHAESADMWVGSREAWEQHTGSIHAPAGLLIQVDRLRAELEAKIELLPA